MARDLIDLTVPTVSTDPADPTDLDLMATEVSETSPACAMTLGPSGTAGLLTQTILSDLVDPIARDLVAVKICREGVAEHMRTSDPPETSTRLIEAVWENPTGLHLVRTGIQLYRLYVYGGEDRHNVSQDIALEKLAERKDVPIEKVKRDGLPMMDKMSGGRPHNGCVLEASPLPQLPLKALGSVSEDPARPGFSVELLHQSEEEAKVNGTADFVSYNLPAERKPFVLLLDGILDPGNLGAILRTAAFMGVNAVAITKHSSATMTAVALKASAGASEVLTLFSVNSTIDFLTRSKESGWMVYAAVPGTKRSRGNSHVTLDRVESYDPLSIQPTILVVGSEGEGLAKPVRREADLEVSIPSRSGFLSAVDSLNVSVATGVLCSAFLKKQSSGIVEIEDPTEDKEGNESQLW
ncbi:Uu.00g106500.m01.CDS01 [Anthostomella pinea]|uniref:Uu.00g106500.m01.CDS01 n=1 Tax=Anthostomella pinea TaxID=933095 RepID=A0AAI8VE61_9PEZI|nr:Uu.00g106500.m01.CDS01 [Anthostomella pinea]